MLSRPAQPAATAFILPPGTCSGLGCVQRLSAETDSHALTFLVFTAAGTTRKASYMIHVNEQSSEA